MVFSPLCPEFFVTDDGEVFRHGVRKMKQDRTYGTARVYLRKGGRVVPFRVSRLVASAFCEGYTPDSKVSHKDGDVQNNRADNLEWIATDRSPRPTEDEEWATLAGTEYEVSSIGRVRAAERILKQWENSDGYLLVRLNQPRRVERVHRLVAACFIENTAGKPFINHIDCNPANNSVGNLEWVTQAENLQHSRSLGRMRYGTHWMPIPPLPEGE